MSSTPASPAPAHSASTGRLDPVAATSVRRALRDPRRLRTEVLAGLVVALALIPEAISFSIIAGVDPRVGLFSSVTMAVTIAVVGGRPAMISAATGAIALVVAPLAREHGIDYLIATVLLGGLLQIVLGLLGVARLMRFVPRSVMVGFVNALAILIFTSQVPHLIGVPWAVYPLVAVGVAIIVLLPRLTTVVPAPLVAIVLLTWSPCWPGSTCRPSGDQGALPRACPAWSSRTCRSPGRRCSIIAPVRGRGRPGRPAGVADDRQAGRRHHRHPLRQDPRGVGVRASPTSSPAFFGGMGGCAMIGQTMINVKVSGARTRISTFLAGAFLLVLVIGPRRRGRR